MWMKLIRSPGSRNHTLLGHHSHARVGLHPKIPKASRELPLFPLSAKPYLGATPSKESRAGSWEGLSHLVQLKTKQRAFVWWLKGYMKKNKGKY